MKFAKLKIAAIAMAAISGVCSMQAITASAAFQYTLTSQEVLERQSTMDTRVARWKNSYWGTRFLPNHAFTETIYSDTVVGGFYNAYVPGGYWPGMPLNNPDMVGQGLVRALAVDYFDTTIFMSFPGGSKEFSPRIGDQICLTRNGVTKFIFITKDKSGIKAVELVDGKIKYDRSYGTGNGFMTYGSERWNVAHYLRPIKEGDANGDSYVYLNSHHNISGDSYDFNRYASGDALGDWGNAKTAALTMNDDWNITMADYNTWYNNLYWYTTDGTMHGNYGFVKSLS